MFFFLLVFHYSLLVLSRWMFLTLVTYLNKVSLGYCNFSSRYWYTYWRKEIPVILRLMHSKMMAFPDVYVYVREQHTISGRDGSDLVRLMPKFGWLRPKIVYYRRQWIGRLYINLKWGPYSGMGGMWKSIGLVTADDSEPESPAWCWPRLRFYIGPSGPSQYTSIVLPSGDVHSNRNRLPHCWPTYTYLVHSAHIRARLHACRNILIDL